MRTSPVFARAEKDFDAEHLRDVNVVLQEIQRLGELDTRVECGRGHDLDVYSSRRGIKELDRSGKGYVTDSDRWHQ